MKSAGNWQKTLLAHVRDNAPRLPWRTKAGRDAWRAACRKRMRA